jgi:adenylate cyclase
VQAAMEIQEEIKNWGKVKVGIGIHSGAAIVGNIGSKHKMDYTAIGDVVNTASRLEGQTKAGEILVSKEVYAEVKEIFPTKYRENILLKGKTNGVEVYRYKRG